MGPVPSRWKGKCVEGADFNASINCNRKIIGARYYTGGEGLDLVTSIKPTFIFPPITTPRDYSGHGTFTASTAAGSFVDNANYNGLAKGTARGGPASSSTRIAMYRVCGLDYGCPGVQILAAFDDAVKDGVDIVSISIGVRSSNQADFMNDAIAIGAFHATQKGILVVSSAGNEGPDSQTVVNAAPWIITVGATSIDRDFQSNVVLGNGKIIQGKGITFSNLSQSAVHPLVYGGSIPAKSCDRPFDPVAASNCLLDCLDANKTKGKIVVCIANETATSRGYMMAEIEDFTGAVGVIVVDNLQLYEAFEYGTFAGTAVSKSSATEIFSYINSTRNPVATITPSTVVANEKPAPVVASFSSRGPGALTQNILKPDISAPGLNIIAAWDPPNTFIDTVLPETMSTAFNMMSGTSVAVPHVSGAAAFLKSMNPTWSPSVIRSALMTTAIVRNNIGNLMTNASDIDGTPFDFGAGVVNPIGALQPGLVYETSIDDYFHFLCNYGLDSENIKLIAANKTYRCPSGAKVDLISNMNYPSIAISKLNVVNGSTIVSRSVTNISPDLAPTYKVTIGAPPGLSVKVSPEILQFSQTSKKLSFDVVFTATKVATKGYVFGSLVWSDGKHNVRTPFAVNLV